MRKKFDVITFGGATVDIMFGLKKAKVIKYSNGFKGSELMAFELGAKLVSDDVVYTPGGGAINTAVSFAKLGLKTAAFSSVGQDSNAQLIMESLKKNQVNAGYLQKQKKLTAMSFIVSGGKKNEHVVFSHRSASDLLSVDKTKLKSLEAKWFYLASFSGKFWRRNLEEIFSYARANKIKIAWNPGSIQLESDISYLKKLLKQTEVLILNKREALELAKSAKSRANDYGQLFQLLKSWGPKLIAITEGEKGARVCYQAFSCFSKSMPIRGVNTTGAGDAFGSSLVGGLMIYNYDLKRSLDLAIIRSNYVVRKIGAQNGLLSLAEARALAKK